MSRARVTSVLEWPDEQETSGVSYAAVAAAVAIADRPAQVRLARRGSLPSGMPLLIAVAARDVHAIRQVTEHTSLSPAKLQHAASFFIEQILFHDENDSYRILGATPEATALEIRRNMALLMRWVHPDLDTTYGKGQSNFSKSLYAGLVTRAWEDLKTAQRRQDYDSRREMAAHRQTAQGTMDLGHRPSSKARANHQSRKGPDTLATSSKAVTVIHPAFATDVRQPSLQSWFRRLMSWWK